MIELVANHDIVSHLFREDDLIVEPINMMDGAAVSRD